MKRNYVDRGREGFRMKSFTTEQLHAISNYHWNRTDKAHESLRDNMAEFNMRAMSLRGEHLRSVELPDLVIDDIGEQGHGECKAVITVLNRGKTNKYGNNEFAATFRSKDVYMCPQSKMAFYFFHRFDQSKEELPNFETNQSWFDIKLFRQSQAHLKKKEVSYDAHLRAVQKFYLACGLRAPKKTHLMRGDSVRYAEAKGLKREERTQMGRWENGAMDACYGRSLPIKAMRTMAGFSHKHPNYKIHRDVEVPEELFKKIFLGVENLLEEELRKNEAGQVYAKIQFLELLIYFRKLILQDSCRLKLKHPDHPIWNHEVFSHPLYSEFQEEVLEASQDDHINSMTLEERLPEVMEYFNHKLDMLHGSFETFRKSTRNNLIRLQRRLNKMKVKVSFEDEDTATMQHTIRRMMLRAEGFDPGTDMESLESETESDYENRIELRKKRRIEENVRSTFTSLQRDSLVMDTDERPRYHMHKNATKYTNNPPPEFKMNRNIKTVKNLWHEWYIGSTTCPSVEFLEETYANKWRKDERDRIWFSKRKTVIRVVHDLAEQNGINKEQAIKILDRYLIQNDKTLNFVSQSPKVVKQALEGITE